MFRLLFLLLAVYFYFYLFLLCEYDILRYFLQEIGEEDDAMSEEDDVILQEGEAVPEVDAVRFYAEYHGHRIPGLLGVLNSLNNLLCSILKKSTKERKQREKKRLTKGNRAFSVLSECSSRLLA